MKKWMLTLVIGLTIMMLAACTDPHNQAAESMYEHLEASVELESEFHEAQSELVELEQQENDLYLEMIEVNMDELDEIEETADQALSIVEERRQLMEVEMDSIDAAKEEFDEIEGYLDDLNESAGEVANDMISTKEDRYQAFVELYESYQTSLDRDEELYNMLKDEDLEKETLDEQVELVNESYDEISAAQETFNEYTNEFNDLKRQFYEAAELEVEFVE
ncbi:YkyA family protein [Alkalibacillus aidingensis]|uniref:YkyA family protein n=1 Tax=Alkalibacillus aidingensis TaxID=2747607 RepID=UPI0016606FA7|nr:YkyA family protein [Alkalibacillus aidingensis]